MKKLIITSIIALLTATWSIAGVQEWPDEYLGLPGDNLNLYAVMKLFQESETLEGFERNLNGENSRINNLDLNADNLVDYIMVFDYADGNLHNIVLRVALNEHENQDVAVFTVERFSNGSVQVQLIGDEALYGKNYIVEPVYADNGNETPNPGYAGNYDNKRKVTVVRTTTYEVAAWPVIRFIYLPTYAIWRSSWYWGYYPSYWNPWRPYYWHYYYGYHSRWNPHYYSYYRHWRHPRCIRYNDFYYNRVRLFSPTVVVNINKRNYRNTYSRPDLRSNGEALYTRIHSKNRRSTAINSTVNRSPRRSTSEAGRITSGKTSSASTRRSSTTVARRTDVNSSVVNANGITRRTANAVNRNDASKSASVQGNTPSRRSTMNVRGRTDSSGPSVPGNITNRRATLNGNKSVSTRPSGVNKTGISRGSAKNTVKNNVVRPPVTKKSISSNRSVTSRNKSSISRSYPNKGNTITRRSATNNKSAKYNAGGSRRSPATYSSKTKSKSSAGRSSVSSRRAAPKSSARVSTKSSSVKRNSSSRNSSSSSRKSQSRASVNSRSRR